MRSDNEWRDFFLLLCECIAVDPSTVRLDGGFRQLFHWIPQHMGPAGAVQHVLEMIPLDVIVLSIALQCSMGENGRQHSCAERTQSLITAPPTIPLSKAEGQRKVMAQCSEYSPEHVESDCRRG